MKAEKSMNAESEVVTPAKFEQRLTSAFFDEVQGRVIERMRREGLDAVLSVDPEDVAYLTGFFFHAGERPVAVWLDAAGACILMLPALERDHAESQSVRARIVEYAEYPGIESPFAALARVVDPAVQRVGHTLTIGFDRLLAARTALPGVEFDPSQVIMRCRYLKLPAEIALHREAARITDAMLVAGVGLVTDAVLAGERMPSEAELAAHVGRIGTGIMYAEHREVVVGSFLAGGLVYAGVNSSFPHGYPSGYRLQPGDTFMLSLGCAVGGRFVEGERTFVLGQPDARQTRLHSVIHDAQKRGRETIRPGLACSEADALCLEVIRSAGLGQHILHRQGHGIGLGMHEPPWLEAGDDTLLEPGMVVSNEPGIYVAGHAGYRISDSMLVTSHGAEPLTGYPRDLEHCVIAI